MAPPARRFPPPCRDCGWRPRAAYRATGGGSCELPNARLGELQAVPSRIAKVDRAPTAGPLEVGLDADALGRKRGTPGVDLARRGAKAEVPFAQHAVRRHRQGTGCGWQLGCVGIEDQQDLVAAAVEQMPAWQLGKG